MYFSKNSFAFPEGSDLSGPFNHHLLKMRQRGVMGRLEHRWLKRNKPQGEKGIKGNYFFREIQFYIL